MTSSTAQPHAEETRTNELLIALYQHGGTLTRTPNDDIYLLPGHAPDELIAKIHERADSFRFRLRYQEVGTKPSRGCPDGPPARYLTVRGCQARDACRQIGPCAQALMRRDCLHGAELALSIPRDEQEGEAARLHLHGVGPKRTKLELERVALEQNMPTEPPWEKRGRRLQAKYPYEFWQWVAKVKKRAMARRWPLKALRLPDSSAPPSKPGIRLGKGE